MFQSLPQRCASPGAPHSSLDDVGPAMGPPLYRRPLPDASPRWCLAPKPLCRVVVRARPVRWSHAPSGWLPGVIGTVAHAAATRRGRWWARLWNGLHGASVGRVSWVRRCLARGSQAGCEAELEREFRYTIHWFMYPRHVAPSLTTSQSIQQIISLTRTPITPIGPI